MQTVAKVTAQKYEVHTIAPTSEAARSIGGLRTLPDYSLENLPKDLLP